MRKRKWALIAFIFMLAFIFISLESWRLLQANEKLKEFILVEFRPIVGDQLKISKVHVSFGNIHILDVRFVNAQKDVSIDIRDLRIGYNFFNLLVRGFHPQYISSDALFIGPTITIHAADDSLMTAAVHDSAPPPKDYAVFSPNFKELHLFSHISIKDGEILFAKNDTTRTRLVHSVQGGIYRERDDSLFIHLDGAFYNSQNQNIQIKGHGDFTTQRVSHLTATLTDYQLQHGMPIVDEHLLNFLDGKLYGDVRVQWNDIKNRYTASGSLNVEDADCDVLDGKLEVTDSFSTLAIRDDKIIIKESTQRVNDSPVHVAGSFDYFTSSPLELDIESTDFELGRFSNLFMKDVGTLTGKSALRASISGPLDKLVIDSQFRSRSLKFNDLNLSNFYSEAVYNGDVLRIDSCKTQIFDNTIVLSGLVELHSAEKKILGRITGNGGGEPLISAFKIDSTVTLNSAFDGIISGTVAQPVVQGHANFDIQSEGMDSLFIKADIQYRDKMLTLGTNPQLDGFFVNMLLDWHSSPPSIDAVCQQPEQLLFYLRDIPSEVFLADHMRSTFFIAGDVKQFRLNGNIVSIAGGLVDDDVLSIEAEFDRQPSQIESSGRFVLYPAAANATHGEFEFERSASAFNLNSFNIENQIASTLTIDRKNKSLDGSFVVNGFDISRMVLQNDSSLAGKIDMDINLSGQLDAPQLEGYVHAQDLLYNKVGPYESLMSFNVDSTKFNLQQFMLNFGASTLLFAQGDYNFKQDSLDFNLKGAGFDAAHLLGAAGRDSIINGKMLVDVHVTGQAKTPDVNGVIGIKDGALANIPFDEVELKLGASDSLEHQRPPSLFIDKFRLSRFNEYELLATGSYPYDASDTLYLDINGNGNFLQALNDVSPFFQAAQSNCSLQSRVRGTPRKLKLEAANLEINDASMEFKSVVPPISNVRAEINFDPNEQFLHLRAMEGKMGTKPFRIRNELAKNVTSTKPLQNIHIGDSDFHFGVLILETPDNGVPLNFVGLMEPEKFGTIELLGREENEQFYFAALQDALTLRGRMNLYDTEVMYPFYEGTRLKDSRVRDFLRNLDWDILVVPTKNTRFVRNFPGAIDEVYVDLKIDENFGGLEITDQLENETFRINGHIRSTKGFIDYLDMNFRVEQFGVDFDRSSLIPVAYGTAKTTVTDSLGISSNIVLTLQTVDNTMDKKSVDDIVRQEEGRARFDQIRFKLSSDNPNIGSSEAQVLASLGYSANNLQGSAIAAIGSGTDNLLFRPLFRPVERELEQTFGLDYVRFSSQLTKNIIMFNLNNNIELNNRLALLESTRIIVGKYLANRFFLQYTGQIESGVGYRYKEKHLGLHHTLGLEYQLGPQVLVELEYDYDSLMLKNRDDKRIVLRHWFPF